uniref:Uncharacterized protein n=1 Tax=Kalanchoe fedtschenkoi TaxID=63787 RepID=A0A7N0TK82_KALFE
MNHVHFRPYGNSGSQVILHHRSSKNHVLVWSCLECLLRISHEKLPRKPNDQLSSVFKVENAVKWTGTTNEETMQKALRLVLVLHQPVKVSPAYCCLIFDSCQTQIGWGRATSLVTDI